MMQRPPKSCCASCFGNPKVEEVLKASIDDHCILSCVRCRAKNVAVFPAERCLFLIEPLLDLYTEDCCGISLYDCLRNDWGIFSNSPLSKAECLALLSDILEDSEVKDRKYSSEVGGSLLSEWQDFISHIQNRQRWLFDPPRFLIEELSILVRSLTKPVTDFPNDLNQERLYRARIHDLSEEGYSSSDRMGAPPPGRAFQGRLNPPGISFLYLADQPETAALEVRASRADGLSIAEFKLRAGLSFIDFRNIHIPVDPFELTSDGLRQTFQTTRLLRELAANLSAPVRDVDAAYDYIPTQFLCEFVRSEEVDCIIYPSAVRPDHANVVLFDPDDSAEYIRTSEFAISSFDAELLRF